eukprot:5383095-Alexandrium_andersonii.AAC.1
MKHALGCSKAGMPGMHAPLQQRKGPHYNKQTTRSNESPTCAARNFANRANKQAWRQQGTGQQRSRGHLALRLNTGSSPPPLPAPIKESSSQENFFFAWPAAILTQEEGLLQDVLRLLGAWRL